MTSYEQVQKVKCQAYTRIQKDSLKDFAKLTNDDGYRTVYEINKSGKKKIIRKDRINENGIFTRYINYNPLHEYKE